MAKIKAKIEYTNGDSEIRFITTEYTKEDIEYLIGHEDPRAAEIGELIVEYDETWKQTELAAEIQAIVRNACEKSVIETLKKLG
ncbi:MAG: hypothetical protein ACFFDY_01090 [Candidatus Thorarchaeota archaeon]